jgi:hypothetical protein
MEKRGGGVNENAGRIGWLGVLMAGVSEGPKVGFVDGWRDVGEMTDFWVHEDGAPGAHLVVAPRLGLFVSIPTL